MEDSRTFPQSHFTEGHLPDSCFPDWTCARIPFSRETYSRKFFLIISRMDTSPKIFFLLFFPKRHFPEKTPSHLWHQYESALQKRHRTNNVSEAWHNRFAFVVSKHHPDLYTALREFQKEQAESMVAELRIGSKVRAVPKQKWVTMQERIQSVVTNYSNYKDKDDVYTCLRTMS